LNPKPTKAETQNMKTETQVKLPLDSQQEALIKRAIRDIPDFPKPGIMFKDLTPLLKEPETFVFVIDVLTAKCKELKPDVISGIEARGFILAPVVAYNLGLPFVPIRKPGKLPHKVQKIEYALEYGTDTVEVHADAINKGDKIVIVDDLLATGGTAGAAYKLLTMLGGNVIGIGFIIELAFLSGRDKLPKDVDVFSLISY
jgi:adenine phosphoribosyltransferase